MKSPKSSARNLSCPWPLSFNVWPATDKFFLQFTDKDSCSVRNVLLTHAQGPEFDPWKPHRKAGAWWHVLVIPRL